ncbi:hypothetical protein HCJ93_18950 [Streptomyces sp. SBST2-5]|uniref:Uncharacterized protein n=1 Tax=Streptomyces composti TaxID=2720025 RepID=A0ABX1A6J3_9ACTN|nr:hypothetical protein [Streptomyces composti]NJP52070.1 hypothetical protein [Streptomyces composti]
MAISSRRPVTYRVCASAVAAVLALPAGVTTALAAPAAEGSAAGGASARTAPPPSADEPPAEADSTEPPPATPSGTADPPDTDPGPTSPSDGSSDEGEVGPGDDGGTTGGDGDEEKKDGERDGGGDGDSGDDGGSDGDDQDGKKKDGTRTAAAAVAEQKREVDEVTEELRNLAAEAPGELTASVEQLTSLLEKTSSARTSPQEREGIVGTARELAGVLKTINASGIPGDVRKDLVAAVRRLVSALDVAGDPEVPPEQRAMAVVVLRRSAAVLELIADPGTPEDVRQRLARTIRQLTGALTMDGEPKALLTGAPRQGLRPAGRIGVGLSTIAQSETSDGTRKDLADATDEGSRALEEANDPTRSGEERAEARKELNEQLRRLKKLLGEEAVARGLPDTGLGEAAERCTDAVFASVSDRKLAGELGQIGPAGWAEKGVKDYWKSERAEPAALEVYAQLRNDEHDEARFEIARLISRLAEEVVPASDLIATIGTPGLQCLQSSRLLDGQGVGTGTWFALAQEVAAQGRQPASLTGSAQQLDDGYRHVDMRGGHAVPGVLPPLLRPGDRPPEVE